MKRTVLIWTIVSVAFWATSLLLKSSAMWYASVALAILFSFNLIYQVFQFKEASEPVPDSWDQFRLAHPEVPATPEEFLKSIERSKEKQNEEKIVLQRQEWLSEFNFFINSQDRIEDLLHGYFSRLAGLSQAKRGLALIKPELVLKESDKMLIAGSYGVSFEFLQEHESEGVTHQAMKEQREITMSAPEAFLNIHSGLGETSHAYIWILPMNAYENTLGVVELAFFSEPDEAIKQEVRQTVVLLAVRLQNIILKSRSEELLRESKQKAVELEMNQQILQRNLQELKLKEDEMQAQRAMLISILNEIPMKVFIKRSNCEFYVINQAVASFHDMSIEDMIGKSDLDFYPEELAREWIAEEQSIMKEGKREFIREDHNKFLYTVKMPFFLNPLKEMGMLGYQMDITETELLKRELQKLKK